MSEFMDHEQMVYSEAMSKLSDKERDEALRAFIDDMLRKGTKPNPRYMRDTGPYNAETNEVGWEPIETP